LKQNFFPLRGKTFTKNAYAVCSAKNRFGVSDTLPAYKSKEKGLSFEPKPLNTLINKN